MNIYANWEGRWVFLSGNFEYLNIYHVFQHGGKFDMLRVIQISACRGTWGLVPWHMKHIIILY